MPVPPESFGAALRRLRERSGLTQERLAERAALSSRAVRALECGERTHPYPHTVNALTTALGLNRFQRDALLEAARRTPPAYARAGESVLLPPPTVLVGRSAEMARLRAWLARPDMRLVTLTGPPGVGKTRLAQELCRDPGRDYDGTFGVALAGLTDENLIGSAICQAIGVREAGRQGGAMDAIARFCQDRSVLIMLDNFEHLLSAAGLLAEFLPRCPGLRLLVSSRASLRIRGEHEFPLEPLPLPGLEPAGPEALAEVPAVALFLDRAQAAVFDFALTPDNAPAIVDICRRLDGLPLALELVAPWIKLLTPHGLLDQLRRRAGLDLEGSRDLPERQRTMANTLAWSCDLLGPDERALFRRLAVFAGSAPLGGVETVCHAAGTLAASTTRLLGVLADHHLIQQQAGSGDEPRMSMLVTVREYGLTLLRESGEADTTGGSHAEYYCALVAQAESELIGPEQGSWFRRIEMELDNIRTALGWMDEHDVEAGLRMVSRLVEFWETRGRGREGLAWVERLLQFAGSVPPSVRAAALEASGLLAARLGEFELSLRRHEESLALSRKLGDGLGVAAAVHGKGLLQLWKGQMPVAEQLLDEALSIRRDIGDEYGRAVTLNLLGIVATELGHDQRAMRRYGESLSIYRQLGNRVGICRCLLNLGVSARRVGDLEESARSLEEAVALARELDAPELLGAALVNLGNVPRSRRDVSAAWSLYAESMRVFTQIGDHRWIAYALECLAWLRWCGGDPRRAVRTYGAAAGLRNRFALPGWPVSSSEHADAIAALRSEVAEGDFGREYEAGARLSLADAIAEAVASDE